jgi:hypothetical protein
MPRGPRKTESGAPAQTGPGIPGQTYGNGVEAQALEAVAPIPNFQTAPPAPGAAPAAAPGAPGVPGQPVQPNEAQRYERALLAAQEMQGQMGLLGRPTTRPNEPVTTGMSMGPGAGPEILQKPPSPMGRLLFDLSMKTGNPKWAEMARKAGMQ